MTAAANPSANSTLRQLTQQFSQAGKLDAIYLRPARCINCTSAQQALAIAQNGLLGDRTSSSPSRNPSGSNRPVSKRQVTLIQAEHIAGIDRLI